MAAEVSPLIAGKTLHGQQEKTFYLETFGCQMNAHDSEKVIGTLQQEGYAGLTRRRKPG